MTPLLTAEDAYWHACSNTPIPDEPAWPVSYEQIIEDDLRFAVIISFSDGKRVLVLDADLQARIETDQFGSLYRLREALHHELFDLATQKHSRGEFYVHGVRGEPAPTTSP